MEGRATIKQKKKLEEGEMDILIRELEKNPQITLQQMAEIALYRFGKLVTTVKIANYLQGRLFNVKSVHYEPLGMNTDANKQRRQEYVLQISKYVQQSKRILFAAEVET